VLDLDATLVDAHSDKQQASRTWKKGFGFHPLLGYVDHGVGGAGESMAELLRPWQGGSNTMADHKVVLIATPRSRCSPAAGEHPWPAAIPSSRFGQLSSTPIEYLQVAPTAIVELDVDGRVREPPVAPRARFVRVRAELRSEDLSPLPGDAWSD